MSTTPTVAISVLLASAAAAGVSFSMRPAAAPTSPADAGADLVREVAALRETCASLRKELDAVRAAPAAVTAASAPERTAAAPTDEQVLAAVEAILKRNAGKGPAAAGAGGAAFDLAKDFPSLVGTSYWENADAWKKAFAAGKMDEVIKQFEALAKQNPNDIPTQMHLANAYMAYLQLDQTKWQYSMKADEVFDKVLALDDTHWEARFTKAMSYTFWPDFLGKKKEAVSHFEKLVAQQEAMPVEDHQAQTYLYLGNLLEQSDPKRAKELWQAGARRHPNNQELRKKVGG